MPALLYKAAAIAAAAGNVSRMAIQFDPELTGCYAVAAKIGSHLELLYKTAERGRFERPCLN